MDHITVDHYRADWTLYIMMYDVNIKEEKKCETSVLTLLLFSSLPIKIWHLWRLGIEENISF